MICKFEELYQQEAQGQRAPAAHDHGQIGEHIVPQAIIDALRQAEHPGQQHKASQDSAPLDQGLLAAAGLALLVGRHAVGGIVDTVIVGCLWGAGLLGAESGACELALLKGIPLFLFRIPVDGPQDKQNHRQPGDGAQQDQQENGGDAGKIVFVLQLHRDETS